MTTPSLLALGFFFALSVVVASSGAIFRPGPWYLALDKPSWTPPDWAFPVVWSILFVLIAISGWLAWTAPGSNWTLFAPFALQMLLNGMWSWLFFGRRRPDVAFVDLMALWLAIAATIAAFATVSALAAWLLVPYLIWVTIAGCLNWSVWRRNPGSFGTA